MNIVVEHTYHADVVSVPDCIGEHIREYQENFDKWLYDKNNDHGLWVVVDGKKKAVSFGTRDFVDYLNEYKVSGKSKCRIVREGLDKSDKNLEGLPRIWF